MNNKQLIEKIEVAFKDVEYPGDDKLVYDNSGKHLECIETAKLFKNKKWQEIPQNFLIEESTSLHFFSKEAFKYYLPAYMIIILKDYLEADDLPDILIKKLTLPTEADVVLLANEIKKHKIDKAMSNVDFNEILLNNLNHTNKSIHQFFGKINLLTKKQCEVILEFLNFIVENHSNDFFNNEPQTAIYRYWFMYGSEN